MAILEHQIVRVLRLWVAMAGHVMKSGLFVREYLHNLEPFIKRENSVSPPSPPANLSFELFCRSPFYKQSQLHILSKAFFESPILRTIFHRA